MSNPPFDQGLHLISRLKVNQPPLITPWFSKHSIAYTEQLGLNLQVFGLILEIVALYNFNNAIQIYLINFFTFEFGQSTLLRSFLKHKTPALVENRILV